MLVLICYRNSNAYSTYPEKYYARKHLTSLIQKLQKYDSFLPLNYGMANYAIVDFMFFIYQCIQLFSQNINNR